MKATVETAIPVVTPVVDHHDDVDLEEPLINNRGAKVEEEENSNVFSQEQVSLTIQYCFVLGISMGLTLQCVSLASTALLAMYFSNNNNNNNADIVSNMPWSMYYWILTILSHTWLVLFPIACAAIGYSWNHTGIAFVQHYILQCNNNMDSVAVVVTSQTKRMTFVSAVRLLTGIVLGCFLAWEMLDFWLGAHIGMLWMLLLSEFVCLALCQGMIVIYDCFTTEN